MRRRRPDGRAIAGALTVGARFGQRGRISVSPPARVDADWRAASAGWSALFDPAEPVRSARRGHPLGLEVGNQEEFRSLVRMFERAGWTVPDDPVAFAALIGRQVDSFHFVTGPARSPAEWLWPLDLAVLDDRRSRELEGRLARLHYLRFVTPVRAVGATSPIELLVWPGSLEAAGEALAVHGRLPRIQLVLVLGGVGRGGDPIGDAERVRQLARADAVCVTAVPSAARIQLLDAFLIELSHDIDADVAFSRACRAVGRRRAPFLVAGAGGLARAHVGRWGRNLVGRLDRMPDRMIARNGGPHRAARDVGHELAGSIEAGEFASESAEATDIAVVGRRVRAEPPDPAARERRVQAELTDGAGRPVEESPLAVGRHQLAVWIGEPTAGAIVATARFPEERLPPSAVGHRLAVALSAPGVLEQPEIRTLDLPPRGASDRVAFALDLPAGLDRLEARVSVLHENRIVQTLLLRADVGGGETRPLELVPEAVLRRDLDGLAGRRPFDAALLFNRLGGTDGMTVFKDETASFIELGEVQQVVAAIERILKDATDRPTRHGKPSSKDTTRLLASLARQGSLLRDELFHMRGVRKELASASRLQIVSAKAGDILPLEICYEPTPPSMAATMCKHWRPALKGGTCTTRCPEDKADTVCPVGFWGMTKVIERHAFDRDLDGRDFAVTAEPSNTNARLPVLRGSLCAAADKARIVEPEAVKRAFDRIASLSGESKEVTSWKAWKKSIEEENPQTLVLLPHTDLFEEIRTLVIGEDSALFTEIRRDYVASKDAEGVALVLLLGCSTAGAEIPLQNFMVRFYRNGARMVIATLCKILGRHAAPVAEAVVGALSEASKAGAPSSLGDVMVRVRRDLLAAGLPIVLAVTALGDADWQI